MNEPTSSFRLTYRQLLAEQLQNRAEAGLQQAYELGRAMLNARLGVLDVVHFHFAALAEMGGVPRLADNSALRPVGPDQGSTGQEKPLDQARGSTALEARVVEEFVSEVLSPFEAARRGFHTAWDQLQDLNNALAERNEALAASNNQLQAEIAERRRAEEALRESKDHLVVLLEQAREMEGNLRELSSQVLTAQEEERKRISRDLHDEIASALTAVNVSVNLLKQHATSDPVLARKVAEAESLLAHSLDMVHVFARSLRPSMLDHLGVHSALRAHIADFGAHTKLRVELEPHPELSRMNGQRGEVIFRVVQEALNNCVKHAHATVVQISFEADEQALTMTVADNGRGFPAAEKLRNAGGRLGLLGMKERARLVGGNFAIESTTGRGTRVRLTIPFENPAASTPLHHEENICTAC